MRASQRIATATAALLTIAIAAGGVSAQAEDAAIGARVRVTTGPNVELPGVIRFQGLVPVTERTIIRDDMDAVRVRIDGQPDITVLRPLRRAVGAIIDADATRLIVASEAGSLPIRLTIPRAAIAHYEVSRGRTSRYRNVLLGLLIGSAAGAAIGFASGKGCEGEPSRSFLGPCFMEPAASTFGGFVIGAGAGALTGVVVPRPERWTRQAARRGVALPGLPTSEHMTKKTESPEP